jgi:hypothetical protein
MQSSRDNLKIVRDEEVIHQQGPKANEEPRKQWSIPPELLPKVLEHVNELRRKFPNMKQARIARKTAAHFKLKEKPIVKNVTS